MTQSSCLGSVSGTVWIRMARFTKVIWQMEYGTAKDLFFRLPSYFVSGNAFSGGSFSSREMTDPETLEVTYIPDVIWSLL